MKRRIVQVCGFVLSTLGWLTVCATTAMNYWRSLPIGGQGGSWIIRAASYRSSLWKDCYIDTTAITNCVGALGPYIQTVQGLLMTGISLGVLAAVFSFVGMDCTYIGGNEKIKDKLLLFGTVVHFVEGALDIAAYSVYATRVARTSFSAYSNVQLSGLRYRIGTPVVLGLVGSSLVVIGAALYGVTVLRVISANSATASQRVYVIPKTAARTYYSGYYEPSRQSKSSRESSIRISSVQNSRISALSEGEISARDAFV